MEESFIKSIINKSDWLILTLFVLYLGFKVIMFWLENKRAKTKEEILLSQFAQIKTEIEAISDLANNSGIKDRIIDSINNKLKIIYAQYGSELSKELAIIVIQSIYFCYATIIANEIYELQKKEYPHQRIVQIIKNRIEILNQEKTQELEGFVYRDRYLVTYTTGQLVHIDKIVNVIENFSDKNGLLRKEIENLMSIEAGIVIRRL